VSKEAKAVINSILDLKEVTAEQKLKIVKELVSEKGGN